jgi:hypothetical protein
MIIITDALLEQLRHCRQKLLLLFMLLLLLLLLASLIQ